MGIVVFSLCIIAFFLFAVVMLFVFEAKVKSKSLAERDISEYRELTVERMNHAIERDPSIKERIEAMYDGSFSSMKSVNRELDSLLGENISDIEKRAERSYISSGMKRSEA